MSDIKGIQGGPTGKRLSVSHDAERAEISKIAPKLFGGYKISWFQLGAWNFIKSYLSEGYANKVREEFFEKLQKDLGAQVKQYDLQPEVNSQTKNEIKGLFQKIMKIPDSDMSLENKLNFIIKLVGNDNKLWAIATQTIVTQHLTRMRAIKGKADILSDLGKL